MEPVDFPFPVVVNKKLTPLGEKFFKIPKSLQELLGKMTWTAEDVVMDIGCGNGYKTAFVILPLVEKCKVFLAIDENPRIVEFGRKKCPAEKLEFHEADIEKLQTFKKAWQGAITKVISIDCFHCLKGDPKCAFENTFSLMAPGGEALVYFKMSSPIRDICDEMANLPKWKEYVNNPTCKAMLSNPFYKLPPIVYRTMLEGIGFEVLVCEKEQEILVSTSDHEFKVLWKESCSFILIPDDLDEEFNEFVFQTVLKYHGRNADGKPLMTYQRLLVHLKKPTV